MFNFVEQTERFDLARRLAMFLLSTVVHIAVILILVLLPLIFIGAVPEVELVSFLIAAPAPPPGPIPPSPPARQEMHPAPKAVTIQEFREPAAIPIGIFPPAPESMPGDVVPGVTTGIPGGTFGSSLSGITASPLGNIVLGGSAPAPPPPPPPKPVRKPVLRTGGDVQQSKLIRRVEPEYPQIAVRARVSGMVVLDVRVDEEGNVESIRVLQGHPLLIGAATKAVAQWKYSPTILNGEPVPVDATVTVIFTLR